ncbi:hypothetical protein AAG906_029262 [Vitis piasezkii]
MLNSRFDMKVIRLADVLLGIKIIRTSDGLILSQSHYVENILGKFDKDNSRVARTLVDVTLHLSKNKYIDYAINKLSRYTSNPKAKNLQGIIRILNNMYNGKSRHICRRHNTIRQLLSTRVISMDYVKSKDNIANPLTKGLNRELVEKSLSGMGLKRIKKNKVDTMDT